VEDELEEPPDEAAADDDDLAAWHALARAHDAGERLDVRRDRIRELDGKLDSDRRPHAFRKATGDDRRLVEGLAHGLVPGAAAVALAARKVVDERDALAVLAPRDHLVTEDEPGRVGPELLDVRAAEPAGEDRDEIAVPDGARRSRSAPGFRPGRPRRRARRQS